MKVSIKKISITVTIAVPYKLNVFHERTIYIEIDCHFIHQHLIFIGTLD